MPSVPTTSSTAIASPSSGAGWTWKKGPTRNRQTRLVASPLGSHSTLRPASMGASPPGAVTSIGSVPCIRSQVVDAQTSITSVTAAITAAPVNSRATSSSEPSSRPMIA